MKRRSFLAVLAGAGGLLPGRPSDASTEVENDPLGVLVDVDKCIGCRKCEWACNQANHLPVQPLEAFEDKSVFQEMRRPGPGNYTVVNEFLDSNGAHPLRVKVQCMHCNHPACRSACLVTAFQKEETGAVTYDPWRCMGCRYCMVACPFQIPAYEYEDAFSPEIRKCTFCSERIAEGGNPACVEICPPQCLIFGRRSKLLELAHRRIGAEPGRYVPHVYGEHEAGGTSWLYIASRPFEELGFPTLESKAPSQLTETTQHAIFRGFLPPLALFGFLGGIMKLFQPDSDPGGGKGEPPKPAKSPKDRAS
jgi:Fe-S-cluster-containing dehydrogenase component